MYMLVEWLRQALWLWIALALLWHVVTSWRAWVALLAVVPLMLLVFTLIACVIAAVFVLAFAAVVYGVVQIIAQGCSRAFACVPAFFVRLRT